MILVYYIKQQAASFFTNQFSIKFVFSKLICIQKIKIKMKFTIRILAACIMLAVFVQCQQDYNDAYAGANDNTGDAYRDIVNDYVRSSGKQYNLVLHN